MAAKIIRARGFTLVELVTVIVIVGILAGIGALRYFDKRSFDADGYAQQVKALLRYGQKVAVAQNRSVFVRLNGSSVALCFNYQADPTCASANQVQAAAGNNSGSSSTVSNCAASASWACEGNPTGIGYTTAPSIAYFYFDALGRPYASSNADGVLLSSFTQLVISITGDTSAHTVTVEAETGYVH